jgi:WD40 repeat protein
LVICELEESASAERDLTLQTGQHLFSSGCDNAVRMYDLGAQGAAQQVAAHDAPVKCVRYIDEMGGMIVTAGWDKKLRVGLGKCWTHRVLTAVLGPAAVSSGCRAATE